MGTKEQVACHSKLGSIEVELQKLREEANAKEQHTREMAFSYLLSELREAMSVLRGNKQKD